MRNSGTVSTLFRVVAGLSVLYRRNARNVAGLTWLVVGLSIYFLGSIPVSSTQEIPRNEAQTTAKQGTSENEVPCFISDEKCSTAHNEDLKRSDFRHITATQTPHIPDAIESEALGVANSGTHREIDLIAVKKLNFRDDLQAVLDRHAAPEHIRAAILALAKSL